MNLQTSRFDFNTATKLTGMVLSRTLFAAASVANPVLLFFGAAYASNVNGLNLPATALLFGVVFGGFLYNQSICLSKAFGNSISTHWKSHVGYGLLGLGLGAVMGSLEYYDDREEEAAYLNSLKQEIVSDENIMRVPSLKPQ